MAGAGGDEDGFGCIARQSRESFGPSVIAPYRLTVIPRWRKEIRHGAGLGDGWFGQTNIPANLTNVTVIFSTALHTLALRSDGTVVSWGDIYSLYGVNNVPAGLTNVVAIAAGAKMALSARFSEPFRAFVHQCIKARVGQATCRSR